MKIHYKHLGIEFKGIFLKEIYGKYQIQVTQWMGKGYPHKYYYLTKEEFDKYKIDEY